MIIFGLEKCFCVGGTRVGDAVADDIVHGLEVERFFDFGVWGEEEVEENGSWDQYGEEVIDESHCEACGIAPTAVSSCGSDVGTRRLRQARGSIWSRRYMCADHFV